MVYENILNIILHKMSSLKTNLTKIQDKNIIIYRIIKILAFYNKKIKYAHFFRKKIIPRAITCTINFFLCILCLINR